VPNFLALAGNTNEAKPAHRLRVNKMKSQMLIGEAKKDFNDSATHDLFDTHTMGTLPVGNILPLFISFSTRPQIL
jgi:hypothetical protein